jgi:hypothetical protein
LDDDRYLGETVSPVSRGRGGRRRTGRSPRALHQHSASPAVFDLPDVSDRKSWTLPGATGSYQGMDLATLDRDDEDERRYLIEAEHPLFAEALHQGVELDVGGEPMSPRLHVAMHEVVTSQLWADDPAEVWPTVQRLTGLGYDRHVVLHMIASLISHDLWETVQRGKPFDREEYARRLDGLPEGWPPPERSLAH